MERLNFSVEYSKVSREFYEISLQSKAGLGHLLTFKVALLVTSTFD